ncbi:hypothetical protein DICVIV_10489 [Dictyocaulus viviparus]|uniref:THO complex subunit 2 N-terminal domain-containing protein n=1 Tax=Dictyocaulus viviparus TaxID=29172 RepID=A0A0D8XFW5_DICVI|nr:hypothetical protein DICVIV_10489 [Dictyocaulus viviparus]
MMNDISREIIKRKRTAWETSKSNQGSIKKICKVLPVLCSKKGCLNIRLTSTIKDCFLCYFCLCKLLDDMFEANENDIQRLILELCEKVILLDLTPQEAFSKLQELHLSCPLLPSLLLDVLVTLEGDAHSSDNNEKTVPLFTEFVNLISDQIIPADILRIELDVLEASLPANKQQLVRLKTRLYYKQAKYNLLREESEGYAKLITELMDGGAGLPPKTMMTRVLCLIGQFNLDPNRVTDIVLECFECCASQKSFYISLLKEIKANKDYLCTLLGFKYTFYHASVFYIIQLSYILI